MIDYVKMTKELQSGTCSVLNVLCGIPEAVVTSFPGEGIIFKEDVFGGRYQAVFGNTIEVFLYKEHPYSLKNWKNRVSQCSVAEEADERGIIDQICLSESGLEALKSGAVELDELLHLENLLYNSCEKVGSGSEGQCHLLDLNGKAVVVKVFDHEAHKKVNEIAAIFRASHPRPDFKQRIGYTACLLADLKEFFQPVCDIGAVTEYWATRNYIVTEYAGPLTVADLFQHFCLSDVQQKDNRKERQVAEFVKQNSVTKKATLRLKQLIDRLRDLASIQDCLQIGFIGQSNTLKPDFNDKNFFLKGFERESGRFLLALTDQGVAHVQSSAEPWFEEMAQCQKAQRACLVLRQSRVFRDWIKKEKIPERLDKYQVEHFFK